MNTQLTGALVLAAFVSTAQGKEVVTTERIAAGKVWFEFEIEPKKIGNGMTAGWFFWDGKEKLLFAGSGWRHGKKDFRKQWGLITPDRKAFDFNVGLKLGEKVRLIGLIDFGGPKRGDESVSMWMNKAEPGKEIAKLSGISLSGIDQARSYVRKGGEFEMSRLSFSREAGDFPQVATRKSMKRNARKPKAPSSVAGEKLFAEKIRPLFAQKCAGCHGEGAKKLKGGFDMRTREGLLAGGDSETPSLIPGKPDGSPLFVSVTWKDSELQMPPKGNDRLSEQQIADLRAWITAGAPWVEAKPIESAPVLTGDFGKWTKPAADGSVKVTTSGGLNPVWDQRSYDAGKTWAFRPPGRIKPPAGGHPVDSFVFAKLAARKLTAAPKADNRTLNRRLTYTLTGLPPTAKQLGMDFETLLNELIASPHYGERLAQHWLDVTRYADSNGFARDEERPDAHTYRTYVIESFNADKPFDRFAREQIAGDELGIADQEALAFLWMGPWEITAMTSAAVARQMWLDDVVNSIGITFLGQELRCAKCHDHKFDPIPTRDYYSMQAVFASTKHHVKAGNYQIQKQDPQKIAILGGGSLYSPGKPVGPGLPSGVRSSANVKMPSAPEGRRAALANWIADERNPLTARVIVNRVWAWRFGRGLVATPNVFGSMGAAPSHPELLDWLAGWFVENGWSIKKLDRLLLNSAAFQRSEKHPGMDQLREADPDGKWLAVFQPRRLTAEEIRDSMLAASGELVARVGGPSFRAEMNWEHAFLPRRAMVKLKVLPPWEPDAKRGERHRRSLYAMRTRNIGHPLMEIFNRPLSEFSCERRDETTVVTQAFSLFHGEFSNARALALAALATEQNPNDHKAQIARVFNHVYARQPTEAETRRSLAHLGEMTAHHEANPPEERPLPTEVELSYVNQKSGITQSFTYQLEGLKNYERDLQPWQTDAGTRALAELCLVLLNSSEFLYVY